jgi:hypothetical protein
MPATKRALAPAGATQPNATISVSPAVDPGTGLVTVSVYDGTRQPIQQGTQILLTVADGAQKQLYRDYVGGPSISLKLPFHNNFADNYSIVTWAKGYEQAGFQPVKIGPNAPVTLDLMLLPKNGTFHFAQAQWTDVASKKPSLARIFAASADDAGAAYGSLMEAHPDILACLLNITTAMEQIFLAQGTPLEYFKQLDLPALAPDRIFGYADAKLVDQVRSAAQQGEFATEPAIDLTLHGDATSSFKQIQFGEANVQLTFHEKNRKTIDGVDCVYVEPDIDYYKDVGAHLLLEVIPNALTGNVSSPRVVYVLRWIAGRHAGVSNFDPLYTIE